MSTGITRDLSAKLQGKIGEVLDRELRLFAQFVSPAEISLILLEAATMLGRTSAATIAGYADEMLEVEKLYRGSIAALVEQLTSSQDEGIQRTRNALALRPQREAK